MQAGARRQRVAAYGLARSGGSVLLVRSSIASDGLQRWWLPGGGVHFAETPHECLARELAEEAGLRLTAARLRDAVSDVQPLPLESVLLHSIRLVYDVTVDDDGVPDLRDGSTDAVEWFPEARLSDLPLAPWLRSYLSRSLAR